MMLKTSWMFPFDVCSHKKTNGLGLFPLQCFYYKLEQDESTQYTWFIFCIISIQLQLKAGTRCYRIYFMYPGGMRPFLITLRLLAKGKEGNWMLGVLIESEDKKMHHWDILYSNAPAALLLKNKWRTSLAFLETSQSKWKDKLLWPVKEPTRVKKMRFSRSKSKNFASHRFSSLAENDAERQLDEKYSGSSFPLILPPEYQQLAVKNPFQFWLETTFPISPRKLLKWHQEEVSEGQDEKTPGESGRERFEGVSGEMRGGEEEG